MDKGQGHKPDKEKVEKAAEVDGVDSNKGSNVAMSRGRILLELAKKQASKRASNVVKDKDKRKRAKIDPINQEKDGIMDGNCTGKGDVVKKDISERKEASKNLINAETVAIQKLPFEEHSPPKENGSTSIPIDVQPLRDCSDSCLTMLASIHINGNEDTNIQDSVEVGLVKQGGEERTSEQSLPETIAATENAEITDKIVEDKEDEPDGIETVGTPIIDSEQDTDIDEENTKTPSLVNDKNGHDQDAEEISATTPKSNSFFQTPIENISNDEETFHGIGPTPRPPPGSEEDGEGEEEEEDDEEKEEFDREAAIERFDTELYEMLQDFFESCFTVLVYKLGLQPKDQFEVQDHEEFGKVPVFCNEESQQYVEEVSKTAVHFIRKGVLDGAVFHVNMLDKENCPITQQRFIFRTRGMFCADQMDVTDTIRVGKTTLMCRTQLLEMLRSVAEWPLEELKCPWYSQWTISLGLKKEFIDLLRVSGHAGPLGPFSEDPASDFFPWKKRPRLSQAVKLGLVNLLPKTTDGNIPPGVVGKILEKRKHAAAKTDRFAYLKTLREKAMEQQAGPSSPPPKPTLPKLPEWEYFTSSSESEDEEELHPRRYKAITRPKQKLYMKPIASQEVLPRLMLLVYTIEYNNKVTVDEEMIQAAKADQIAHELFLKFSD